METTTKKAPRKRKRRRKGRKATSRRSDLMAALDLGTNNCRLLIAQEAADGGFHVVDSFSRIVRLGEGVAATGMISDAAISRTLAALRICADRIRRRRVSRLRAVATEAARKASNARVLLEMVQKETGLKLDIITAEEEARLAAVGCGPLIGKGYEGALVFDIGGGSTEIIWMARSQADAGQPRVIASKSLPLGVVVLAEREQGRREDFRRLTADMVVAFSKTKAAMDKVAMFDPEKHHLLGTSGTVTTLAGIAMGLPRYIRSRVDASWHDREAIAQVIEDLAGLSVAERAEVACVGKDRADLILAGCAIYKAIETLWPCARLRVADRGLREGLLRELRSGSG